MAKSTLVVRHWFWNFPVPSFPSLSHTFQFQKKIPPQDRIEMDYRKFIFMAFAPISVAAINLLGHNHALDLSLNLIFDFALKRHLSSLPFLSFSSILSKAEKHSRHQCQWQFISHTINSRFLPCLDLWQTNDIFWCCVFQKWEKIEWQLDDDEKLFFTSILIKV